MVLLEEQEWRLLLRSIRQGHCILLLGPGAAIDPNDPRGYPLPVRLALKFVVGWGKCSEPQQSKLRDSCPRFRNNCPGWFLLDFAELSPTYGPFMLLEAQRHASAGARRVLVEPCEIRFALSAACVC
jgi:hypothetical protein